MAVQVPNGDYQYNESRTAVKILDTVGDMGFGAGWKSDGAIMVVGFGSNDKVRTFEYTGGTYSQIGSDINGTAGSYFGADVAVSADGLVMVIGAFYFDGAFGQTGRVYTYDWSTPNWVLRGTHLESPSPALNEKFGVGVALSSDGAVLAVGTFTTGVHVYEVNGSSWDLRETIGIEAGYSKFGYSVNISGDASTLVIGADGGTYDAFLLYDWTDPTWTLNTAFSEDEDVKIEISAIGFHNAKSALNDDGTKLVLSTTALSNPAGGALQVYDLVGGTWELADEVVEQVDNQENCIWGRRLAILDNDEIVVTAVDYIQTDPVTGQATFGATYFYTREASYDLVDSSIVGSLQITSTTAVMTPGIRPTVPNPEGVWWGHSVALSADKTVLVVGNSDYHEVHTYDWNGSEYIERASSPINYGLFSDDFASSLDLSADGQRLVVATLLYDGSAGSNTGGFYVFDYNSGTDAWDAQNGGDPVIEGGTAEDQMGRAICLSDDGTILFVASSPSGGWNNDGFVEIYDWVDPNWVFRAGSQLLAPTASPFTDNRSFGHNISCSGDGTVLVATFDDYSTTQTLAGVFKWTGSWAQQGDYIVPPAFPGLGFFEGVHMPDPDGDIVIARETSYGQGGYRKLHVYDWVDPDWVKRPELLLAPTEDQGSTIRAGVWATPELDFVALLEVRSGASGVGFHGFQDGPPCIKKTSLGSNPIVVGEICVEDIYPPVASSEPPPNVPRPPGEDSGLDANCLLADYYDPLIRVAQDIASGTTDYDDWLVENLPYLDSRNGICD